MAALFAMPFALHAGASESCDSIVLERRLCRIEYFEGTLYGAPCIGTSIFRFSALDESNPISFTDDVNYRIRGFKPTPFALYINRGTSIEKYYPAAGVRETVYAAGDIVSFDLTDAEEVILADRQKQELIFLDFAFQKKYVIANIAVEDLQWRDGLLYVLAKNRIHLYDEHGNLVETKAIPERCNRIRATTDELLIFSEKARCVFKSDTAWSRIELPFTVLDICEKNDGFLILDGPGATLYICRRSSF
ncbi:hypothetical protein IBX73_00700 [candidate division WOR-3 bacterium]|nr:hypothetical protein [candidate division WOR-3 bacterium]